MTKVVAETEKLLNMSHRLRYRPFSYCFHLVLSHFNTFCTDLVSKELYTLQEEFTL